MQHHTADELRDDAGFGLVEVVVSMFVLAVLALAFLPLLVNGLKQSAANATLATATQLVNERLEQVRAGGATCSTIGTYAVDSSFQDVNGADLVISTTVGTCPDATGTVLVNTVAKRADTGQVLVEAATRVFLE